MVVMSQLRPVTSDLLRFLVGGGSSCEHAAEVMETTINKKAATRQIR